MRYLLATGNKEGSEALIVAYVSRWPARASLTSSKAKLRGADRLTFAVQLLLRALCSFIHF